MSGDGDGLRLGFLYPGYAAESDYPELVARLPVPAVAEVVHTALSDLGDAHTVEALHAMGEADRLADGADALTARGVAAVVWSCTSGSFCYGYDGAHQQVRGLGDRAGVPASSTSLAFLHAIAALGVRRVTVAATYPEPVVRRFAEFLHDAGIEVVAHTAADIMTATAAGEADDEVALRMVAAADHRRAQAVLVPDTALHTARVLPLLRRQVGKPVLTANQVSVWEALRLTGTEAALDLETAGAGGGGPLDV